MAKFFINVTYIGKRIQLDKLYHAYVVEENEEVMYFRKPLSKHQTIGTTFQAERTDNGVKGPYTRLESKTASVLTWSVAERESIEKHRELLSHKEKHDEHLDAQIDKLVKSVRDNAWDRRRIAFHVYNRILRG